MSFCLYSNNGRSKLPKTLVARYEIISGNCIVHVNPKFKSAYFMYLLSIDY
jgi:hypothetical protein